MLPTHIPTSCLPRILKDFASLIKKDCDPGTDPLEWIGGCSPEEGMGYLPFEGEPDEEDQELDPIKRLLSGEELAIRLHTSFVGKEITLIDGHGYRPSGSHSNTDEQAAEIDEYRGFPGEMSFYALGLQLVEDQLRVRPVVMYECSNPGGVFHRSGIAEFPPSFMARIESYLNSMT